MKQIAIYCVTYNSYDELQCFLHSVEKAAERVAGQMDVHVYVADNTTCDQQEISFPSSHIRVTCHHNNINLGYLGAALPIWNTTATEYDYVAISNVDLALADDFFVQLLNTNTHNVGWLAPDIYTAKTDVHENPHMLARPTRTNFIIWRTIYSSRIVYRMYHALHLLKRSGKKAQTVDEQTIYAAHGSFMLFTREFVGRTGTIVFPTFLYGEEIFFAELMRRAQLLTKYTPQLIIYNTGNVSTGKIPSIQSFRWRKDSLGAIYQKFFS